MAAGVSIEFVVGPSSWRGAWCFGDQTFDTEFNSRTLGGRRRRPMSTSSPHLSRQLAGLVAVVAFAVTVGGAASSSAAGSPQSGGSIKIGIVGDPGTINPMKDGGIADNYVSELIRDRLVCSGQDG